jgi:outer membrane protein OmpA-like peptidoglycan-associated protein
MTSSHRVLRGLKPLFIIMPLAAALGACSQPPSQATTASAYSTGKPSTTPSDLQLYFDTGSSALSADSNQQLDQAARLYREGNPLVMFVAGHSDQDGAEYPNLVLSGERAQITKQALVARGIPADRLQLQALGSSLPTDPAAPMPDNNRRVVITWR